MTFDWAFIYAVRLETPSEFVLSRKQARVNPDSDSSLIVYIRTSEYTNLMVRAR
jgi:hypothetical protein